MKWLIQLLFSFGALICFSSFSLIESKEEIQFCILHKGKDVGQITVTETLLADGRIQYKSFSETEARVVMKVNVLYEFDVYFKNGFFHESKSKVIVNGNVRSETEITKDGDKFCLQRKKRAEIIDLGKLEYTAIHLLLKEPKGMTKVFSEEDGTFHRLELKENKTYHKTNGKGKVNTYTYENGHLVYGTIDAGMMKFTIQRN